MITNWQDPVSGEIYSSHISGMQDAIGKIEDSIGLQTVAESGLSLSEVFIEDNDRYRIYQCAVGRRNWLASPAPVIKKNGVTITEGFTIDYGGGAIILYENAISTDFFTVDCTRTNSTNSITPGSIGAETPSGAQNKVDTHAAIVATLNDLGHVKIGSDFYTGLEYADNNVLRIKHKPQILFGHAEYTDSFETIFNTTKKIFLSCTFLPYRMLTVIVKNISDNEKFLVYHVFPQYGYTYGVVWGRNSNNNVLALPYPGNGEAYGIVSSATDIGYGVAGTARMGVTVRGIYTSGGGAPEFQIGFVGVEAISQSLNCRVEFLLS